MRLTPLDIRKQEFKTSLRGYDKDEVNTFLEMVAEEFEALIRERERLNEEATRLRTQLHDYQEVERTLKHALKSAEVSAQQTVENARRQAEIALREADMQAEKTLHDAKVKLADLKNELLLVKAQKDSFARRLRHLLESQLELIGVLEMDDLGFGEPEPPARPAPERSAPARSAAPPAGGEPLRRPVVTGGGGSAEESSTPAGRNETFRPTATREAPRRNTPRGSATDFRPVAEVPAPGGAREENESGKKEPRISDHLIT